MQKYRMSWKWVGMGGLALALGLVSRYNYLLFHSLVELFSVAVGWSVFMIAWNSRRFADNNYVLFVGLGLLFVGGLDALHMLAYQGMGVFPGRDANLATQLWIAARYAQSLSLLVAPLVLGLTPPGATAQAGQKLNLDQVLAGYGAVTGLALAAILGGAFPACYVEGVGLTPFKVVSEYVICLVLLAALFLLRRRKSHFDERVLRLLTWFIVVTIGAELAFTLYVGVTDLLNLTGHLLRLAAIYLLYEAVVETGLVRPYSLLFRNLKQSEKELRQLSRAVEQSPASIVITDRSGSIEYVNPKFTQITGYTLAEARGQNPRILKSGYTSPEEYKRLWDTITAGGEWRGEFCNKKKNGELYWESALISPITDEAGNITRFLAVKEDITGRKQVEAALRQALEEERRRQAEIAALLTGARAVLEYREFAPAAQAIFNACKNLIGASGGYVALTTPDGAENEVLFLDSGGRLCTVDPMLPMPIRGMRAEAYRTGQAIYHNDFDHSAWAALKPAGHVDLDNVLFAPLALKGRVVGLLGLANKPGGFGDDDARIASAFGELAAIALLNSQTLESLEISEERFRSVAQTAGEAIISIDSQGHVVLWNNAAQAIFGYPADEAIGRPVTFIMPERFRAAHQAGMERVVSTGEARILGKTVEMAGLRKSGEEFPMELSLAAWKTREGVFFTAIIRDITGRKQAEDEIARSLREKEALLKEIHHRVKNNLQIVSSLLNLQLDYIQDAQALAIFKESQARVRSMALIHEKLYRSADLAHVDLGEYVRSLAASLFRSYAADPGAIALNIDVEGVFLSVNAAVPCGLIINELLTNSLKHAFPPGRQGEIRVWARAEGSRYTLLVSDTGTGFPPGLDLRATESLGLQLVTSLVEQLDGTIEMDTSRGTAFKITFGEKP